MAYDLLPQPGCFERFAFVVVSADVSDATVRHGEHLSSILPGVARRGNRHRYDDLVSMSSHALDLTASSGIAALPVPSEDLRAGPARWRGITGRAPRRVRVKQIREVLDIG